MTVDMVPGADLVPSLPSRVVTVNLVDGQEGDWARGKTVTFTLVGDVHVAADRRIVTADPVVLSLPEGQGRVRLPVWSAATGDWAILVRKSWAPHPYLIRVPAGGSEIDLSQINPLVEVPASVNPNLLITNASASVVQDDAWDMTVAVSGGTANFVLRVPEVVIDTAALGAELAATKWPRGSLTTTNLDTITTPGAYWQSTAGNATTARGYPRDGMLGVLTVTQAASSIAVQTYQAYDSTGAVEAYTRTVTGTGPTAWRPISTPPLTLGTRSLGAVTTPGTYWQSTAANATIARGYPRDGMLGVLTVTQAAGSLWLQELVHYDSSGPVGTYYRTVTGSTATEWRAASSPALSLSTSSLDTLTTPGVYFQSLSANATIARGYPRDGMLCVLTVTQAASSLWLQEFVHYDSTGAQDIYHRTVRADGVTPWRQLGGGAGTTPAPIPTATPRTASRRGAGVQLRFDDSYESCIAAAEYMAERGMSGYVAACPGIPGTEYGSGTIIDAAGLTRLAVEFGWEVGNHTSTHVTITAPDFLARVDEASAMIAAMGLDYPSTFTYPTGARSKAMDREMALRFDRIQLVTGPDTSPVRLDQPQMFTGWTVISGTATSARKAEMVARAKRYVTESVQRGCIPTLAFHGIGTPGEVPTHEGELDWATFTGLIDWLATQGYESILPRALKPYNLVADGGFNANPVLTDLAFPWTAAETGAWERATTGQHSGHGCLRLAASTATSGAVSQGIALVPGTEYRIHVNASMTRSAGTVAVEIAPQAVYGDAVGPVLRPITMASSTAGYQDHTATFTAPAGAQVAQVRIVATGLIGTALVDHVYIAPADLPDPLTV